MRKIKFRAWDSDCEEMFYSDKQYDTHFFEFKNGKLFCFTTIQDGFAGSLYEPPSPSYEELANLMQFTGLLDSKGKEIFEGDILRLWYDSFQQDIIVKIEFREGGFWFNSKSAVDCNWHFYNQSDREIIGNLYENPELLQN
jgi:uncharacterized phage protein (TIGR01671 family)